MLCFIKDEEVIGHGVIYLHLISLMYVLPAVTNGIQGYFRGIGDLKITLISSFVNMGVRVLAAAPLVFKMHLGIEALPYFLPCRLDCHADRGAAAFAAQSTQQINKFFQISSSSCSFIFKIQILKKGLLSVLGIKSFFFYFVSIQLSLQAHCLILPLYPQSVTLRVPSAYRLPHQSGSYLLPYLIAEDQFAKMSPVSFT